MKLLVVLIIRYLYKTNCFNLKIETIIKKSEAYENDRYRDIIAKYARNEAVLIDRIKDLRKKCGQLNTKEDTNNFIKNGTNYVPKGTIKYIRLAMKYTHPDAGGSDEDFIKCNNIYKELKEKYKEI